MPEFGYVNPVELSPLILAECKTRVMRDLNQVRTNTALADGLAALYAAAVGRPVAREHADQVLRRLAVPLARCPTSCDWRAGWLINGNPPIYDAPPELAHG